MLDTLETKQSFEEAIKNESLCVVHFSAKWAEQCEQVDEVLDVLRKQKEYEKINCYSCPAEDLPDIALKYQIEAVPTVVLFKSTKEIARVNGADPVKITEAVRQNIDSVVVPLEERLKALVTRSKVMLFMKGDRNQPRCGFSRQTIDILNGTGVSYETFDILSDEEVRQGLKTYSDWPTYPQLYVNGELVGGLDIIKEMLAGGELVSTLNA